MDTDLIDQIARARANAVDASRPDHVAQAHDQGRLTVRERIARLVDAGSFVEYGALAGATTRPEDKIWSDALVGGVGLVEGHAVVAASYDVTVADGTQSDRNQRKLAKLMYLAVEHRWPFVCFADGAGARADDPWPAPPIAVTPRGRFDLYDGLAELNGWAPTIAVVSGRCADGHAAIAMLSDLVIATEDTEFAAHGGPARPAAEFAKSGDADLIVSNEEEAIAAARHYLALYLIDEANDAGPADGADDIADVIPENRRRPYDMRKVVAALVDRDSLLELGAGWGRSMLTALARMGGRTVGVYANQPKSPLAGAIDAAAADKAARFIELCDAYEYPIVSLIDNPGYMVGPKAEREGIARHHARPLSALHHRTVPLYSVQIRKAYGLGPYAMSGWGSARRMPELRLAWPSVESGGMSLEGAAYLVKRKEIRAAKDAEEALAIRDAYAEKMRDANSGLRAGRSYQFDDVIAPAATRDRIIAMLERTPRALDRLDRIDGLSGNAPLDPAAKKHPIDPR
jgi:acetyl-CoA carboxylase carboxyltransferase component